MIQDKTTLRDLSVFHQSGQEDDSVFRLVDHTVTQAGREQLKLHFLNPPASGDELRAVQETILFLTRHLDKWPKIILNGTIVMLENYFDSADSATVQPGGLGLLLDSLMRKAWVKKDHSLQQFSLLQVSDFIRGCQSLVALGEEDDCPAQLSRHLALIGDEMKHRLTGSLAALDKNADFATLVRLDFQVKREMKHSIRRLILLYARLDAWQSMATATRSNKWVFPRIIAGENQCFCADGLVHPLVSDPVAYDLNMDREKNFLILTGANMSGKTTLLRAVGIASLLAHLGMGVPAQRLELSYMSGMITNMHVEDNLARGESYFLAEVLRMKNTALKLQDTGTQLVLLDELFKGTNVHDACECTKAVIEGLTHRKDHLVILSTHLYEVARQFEKDNRIRFAYFETRTTDRGTFEFTYKLRNGISDDRIGFLILQREGVIKLLEGES